jgi:hypothetical protein
MGTLVALGITALLVCAGAAGANEYTVHGCRVDGSPAPLDGWIAKNAGTLTPGISVRGPFDDCAASGGFGVDP